MTITSSRASLRRMVMRDPNEPHRAASPLELFDLVFVVAVSFAAQGLHHDLVGGHDVDGVVYYVMAFFGIWWAWMNFTWFATSFDTDDWLYRVVTIVQMGGALTYAAGIPGFLDVQHPRFTLGVVGYVIMRLPTAFQWFRAARDDPSMRSTTLRYGWAILVVQVFWVALLIVPRGLQVPIFFLGVALELLVPIFAERVGTTAWHRRHITERYGLFTIIVLGESILASTNAVVDAASVAEHLPTLILLAATSLVIVAAFWWLYFALPQHELLRGVATALGWGYGHYLVFASAAALSAGIEIAIDASEGRSDVSPAMSAAALAVPCAVYVLAVWVLVIRPQVSRRVNVAVPFLALATALATFAPFSAQVVAVLLVAAVVVVSRGRRTAGAAPPSIAESG